MSLLSWVVMVTYLSLANVPDMTKVPDGNKIHSIVAEFTYREFSNQKLVKKITAEELLIKPRPLLFFNLPRIMEAVLINVHTDFYVDDSCSLRDSCSLQMELLPLIDERRESKIHGKELLSRYGHITRIVIEDLVLNFYRDTKLLLVASARRATQKKIDAPWLLENTLLWHPPTGKRVMSNQMVWNPEDKLFKISRSYWSLTADGYQQKRGPVSLSLDLEPVSFIGRDGDHALPRNPQTKSSR